eukprot:1236341-Pyramimonas_sp.AAC.1
MPIGGAPYDLPAETRALPVTLAQFGSYLERANGRWRGTPGEALVQAATSGDPKFFLGTDSAPHAKNRKVRSRAHPPAPPPPL